jgi:hypothetical protein
MNEQGEKRRVYVAVDIGCIECGESSRVIGVFIRQEDADNAAEQAEKEQAANWGGQHEFIVQEVIVDGE